MKETKILIVDDEKNLRESLVELVESEGFQAEEATDGAEALLKIRYENFACIFLDIRMPRMDGLQLLAKLREENLGISPVIIISAFSESQQTIEAMRLGAFDYITKPLDIEEILQTLNRALLQFAQTKELTTKNELVSTRTESSEKSEIIGTSRAMREVFKQIGRVAATNATVLITGESGTGKELVARAIHTHSARRNERFVAVNCGALPENLIETELFGYEKGAFTGAVAQKKGRFEIAHKGTIFLDEIGEMPLAAQVKLLRVLQERKIERIGGTNQIAVDVRVIAATNRNLQTEIAEKMFREDLFYRLNVVSIHLPPLRERLADVPLLADYFLERAAEKHALPGKNITDSALRALINYDFPGNVRELENIIERAVVTSGLSNSILAEQIFQSNALNISQTEDRIFLNLPFKEAIAKLERVLIENALRETDGNRSEAARKLGINRRLLYDKISEHQIKND